MAGIRLASPREIALMKAYTIGRRTSYRDYIDLYFLLKILKDFYGLRELPEPVVNLWGLLFLDEEEYRRERKKRENETRPKGDGGAGCRRISPSGNRLVWGSYPLVSQPEHFYIQRGPGLHICSFTVPRQI